MITPAAMHKIANIDVDVKYLQPGKVVAYVSIIFEVYKNGNKFYAIPLANEENKRLTNLPAEFSFRIQNGTIYAVTHGLEEVVESLVERLKGLDWI